MLFEVTLTISTLFIGLFYYLERNKIKRVNNICCFCLTNKLPAKHNFLKCPLFLLKITSPSIYYASQLHESDELAFTRASILPYYIQNNQNYILLHKENNGFFNFISTERQCINKGKEYRLETSKETMLAAVEEMLASQVTKEIISAGAEGMLSLDIDSPIILWQPSHLNVIYCINISPPSSNNGHILKWFNFTSLDSEAISPVCKSFLKEIVSSLQ
jgi:hypothetical protein